MLQGKNKLSKTKEQEGDDSYRRLFRGATPLQLPFFLLGSYVVMQLLSRKMKGNCSCAAPKQAEEGLCYIAVA
jgi:hypothetical protein